MTTVVALARDGSVWMAADSCTNVYERPIPNGAQKILRVKAGDGGGVLIGVAGDGALPGVLAADLHIDGLPGVEDEADQQRWAHAVAAAVTELATGAGLLEGGRLSSTLLLGWGGRVWTLTHAQAIPHADGVAAVGSGEGPAIGAVDALLRHASDMQPAQIVVEAVRIAAVRDRYTDGQIVIHVLPAGPPSAAVGQ